MKKVNRRTLFGYLSGTASVVACKTLGSGEGSAAKAAETTYDYIVVGTGAGGGPLAVNLAKAGFQVLALEAGNDPGKKITYQVPAYHTQSSEDPGISWDFFVKHFDDDNKDKQDSNYTPERGGILYPRAGAVGGCTSHNAMINVYPLQKDWQGMGEDIGDPSWNAKVMRAYYALLEKTEYLQDPSRKRGWLSISMASPLLVLKDRMIMSMILAAGRSMGTSRFRNFSLIRSLIDLVVKLDTNSELAERDSREAMVMIPLAITKTGKRNSVRENLIAQVGKNLTLKTNCLVTRILFDEAPGEAPKAIGVEYKIGERIYKASKNPLPALPETFTANVRREVIIAGGAFNTPQLLMLSGIGPKSELEAFESQDANYKVILDRPGVGKNLQDRYEVGVVTTAEEPLALIKNCTFEQVSKDPCFADWEKSKGVYTSNGGVIGILKKSHAKLSNPDLFIFLLPSDFRGYYPGYSQRIATSKQQMTWAILKSHTHNRAGFVRLRSLDPTEQPSINFRYYEDGTDENGNSSKGDLSKQNKDLDAVVSGIKYVRGIVSDANNIYNKLKFSDLIPDFIQEPNEDNFAEAVPGKEIATDSELREWVRRHSWGHHACGTCKMGRVDDPMAVVDSKFRVIGAKGLRIVDASIFPRIPGYFIASSIYTISERASDEILEDAGVSRRVSLV